jgi:hypothetical protein
MGLDTYASSKASGVALTDEHERAFEEADIKLCGGMFSGGGESFRGKVYNDLIREITDVDLYQFWIPPETVRQMHRALQDCHPDAAAERTKKLGRHQPQGILELRRFVRVCTEHDLGLVG